MTEHEHNFRPFHREIRGPPCGVKCTVCGETRYFTEDDEA